MKKILTIIILMIGSLSIAQPYQSIFGTTNTQWNIAIGNLWGQGTDEHNVIGDTIINGETYKVIDGYTHQNIKAYIHEDTLSGKTWYRTSKDSIEYLIMDLDLELGDSFYIGGNWNPHPGYYEVDSIYFLNGRKYLRFNFDLHFRDNEKFLMIEGVSGNLGFRYQDNTYVNNFNPYLYCMFKDDERIYGSEPCFHTTDKVNQLMKDAICSISPNPVRDILYVKSKVNENLHYRIHNQNGHCVSQNNIYSVLKNEINVKHLISGLYFLSVYDQKNKLVAHEKFIKI